MEKRVVAFEPVQRNLHHLCKNIKANGWTDAEIFPLVLSDDVGILDLFGGNTGASIIKGWADTPVNYVTLAPSSTMDLVLGDRLSGKRILVLVDIEGAEYRMLEGAKKMLASDPRPVWIVEIMATEQQPSGIAVNPNFQKTFQLFFDHGYKAFVVGDEQRAVSMDLVNAIARGDITLGMHNFLFR